MCPEGLGLEKEESNMFQTLKRLYLSGKLDRIVIDEVHLVKIWGESFRKDFSNLGKLKEIFEETPILGLSTQQEKDVLNYLLKALKLDDDTCIFQNKKDRENLAYMVLDTDEFKASQLSSRHDNNVAALISKYFKNQSGIIYCQKIERCDILKRTLDYHGISCETYY